MDASLINGWGHSLLKEVGERGDESQGDAVPVDGEDDHADAHVEGRPGHHMEPRQAELKGQHPHQQFHFLWAPLHHLHHL